MASFTDMELFNDMADGGDGLEPNQLLEDDLPSEDDDDDVDDDDDDDELDTTDNVHVKSLCVVFCFY
jgi:hypothetical protein